MLTDNVVPGPTLPAELAGPPPSGMYVLIVDEDAAVRDACVEIASRLGYVTDGVGSPGDARAALASDAVDIMLLNLKTPLGAGLRLLEEIKTLHPETAVIVMSASATVPSAVEAMRSGAKDLISKPFSGDELSAALERAAQRRTFDLTSRRLRERLRTPQGLGHIIGRTAEMEKLYRMLAKVAQSTHPALIVGENGTGKELVARSVHAYGSNADQPFFPVDCGSLAPSQIETELFGYVKGAFSGANRDKDGLLVAAGRGTVFLDEVGELPHELQSRLLRALQEREVRPVGATRDLPISARLLAATNRDLGLLVGQGRFRKDLFHRLNIVTLRIPPLRERRADIPLLAAHFLDRLRGQDGSPLHLSDEALRIMVDYSWPGNVRELENAIQRGALVVSGMAVQLGDLSTQLVDYAQQQWHALHPASYKQATVGARLAGELGSSRSGAAGKEGHAAGEIVPLAIQEKHAILATLDTLKGDKLCAAKMLGIGKTTLYRKLKEYGIVDQPAVSAS